MPGRREKWTTIRSRRCPSGGASNSLHGVSVSRGIGCRIRREFEDKYSLAVASRIRRARRCLSQRIVNSSRSRALHARLIFAGLAIARRKSPLSRTGRVSPGISILRCRGIAYARHVFKAAKLPGKFIIAFIIGKTERSRPQTIYSRVKLNPEAHVVCVIPLASYSAELEYRMRGIKSVKYARGKYHIVTLSVFRKSYLRTLTERFNVIIQNFSLQCILHNVFGIFIKD